MALKKSVKSKYLSIRPSEIIEAKYSLSKRQSDLVDLVLQQVQDDDNVKFRVDMEKYCKIAGIEYTNPISEYKDICDSFSKETGFYLGTSLYITSWFSSIRYVGDNIIEVELSGTFKEILVNCKRGIFYRPNIPIGFKSKHTPRIYYFLKLYEDTGFRIDKLSALLRMLECESMVYYDFKRYVLEIAKKEINNNKDSDLRFEYETIKVRRKVEAIKFNIVKVKESNDKPPELIEHEDKVILQAFQLLKVADIKLSKRTLAKIRKLCDDDELFIDSVNILIDNNGADKIKAPSKYLTAIIENQLELQKQQPNSAFNNFENSYKDNFTESTEKKFGFNNFISREYDYDTLEDRLRYGLQEGETAENILHKVTKYR